MGVFHTSLGLTMLFLVLSALFLEVSPLLVIVQVGLNESQQHLATYGSYHVLQHCHFCAYNEWKSNLIQPQQTQVCN